MSNKSIEQEIQDKNLNAPRLTPSLIEGAIVAEKFIVSGVLTICILTLKNGFTVTGESACASPENFDQEIGEKIARTMAVEKIWPLEGYLLKQYLFEDEVIKNLTPKERVEVEGDKLHEKISLLDAWIINGQPEFICDEHWALLNDQLVSMREYLSIINFRLKLM